MKILSVIVVYLVYGIIKSTPLISNTKSGTLKGRAVFAVKLCVLMSGLFRSVALPPSVIVCYWKVSVCASCALFGSCFAEGKDLCPLGSCMVEWWWSYSLLCGVLSWQLQRWVLDIYSSQSRGPTGQCGLQLAGVWVTRGLKCKLIESVQWHRDELTRCTFLFSLPKTPLRPLRWSKKVFALMLLADACALLWRGELDILHILRYKYPCDVYCTR